MIDISWTDLNPSEQHVIAVLGAGMPVGLCDAAAVRSLKRARLVSGSRLTRKAGRLRKAAILQNLTNIRPLVSRIEIGAIKTRPGEKSERAIPNMRPD